MPLKVSEIFYTVQGEGTLAGVPSVFVRLSGCNLRCVWCDTPYASWSPQGEDMALGTILSAVRRHMAGHVVVTGGEPMIQDDIVLFTQRLKEHGQHITIETAGTMFKPVACDLMSISPKLANSTPARREGGRWAAQHDRLRYQPDILKQLIADYPYQLKFVLTKPEDLVEIKAIIKEIGAARDRVVLMAEGTEPGVLYERALWLVEMCKFEGYRYSPRIHIDLWGNERGR